MKLAPNLRIFITGKTQSGKTFLTKSIIKQFNNFIVYDIKRQYGELGAKVHSIENIKAELLKGNTKLIYQPVDLSPEHFDEVCKYIFFNLKNILFVVEEAHKFATKHKIPPYFNSLITMCQGEPYFIGVISITQRPANIHNDIISSSTIVISFKLTLQSDAEAVTGIEAKTIHELPQFHYAKFDDRIYTNPVSIHKPI